MAHKNHGENIDRETRRLFVRFSRPYKKWIILGLILRPIYLFAAYTGNILLISIALDRLARPHHNGFWQDFGPLILTALVLEIVRIICEQSSLAVTWRVQMRVENDIAEHVYENLTYRDANFLTNHFTGSLVSQTNKFIGAYARITDTLYWQVYPLVVFMLTTIIILGFKLQLYAIILTITVCIYTYISYRGGKRNSYLSSRLANKESKNMGQLADTLTNALAVKSYAKERYEIRRFKFGLEAIQEAGDALRIFVIKKDVKLTSLVSVMSSLALVMSVVAVYGGYASVGTIVLATSLTRDTLQRLREFNSNMLRTMARAIGDARDMTEILTTKTEVLDTQIPQSFQVKDGAIDFKNVLFWYPEKSASDALFTDLNLHIEPGEKVGLVGPSGGGKTTITKLLLRFMDIQDGSIQIDGQDIAKSAQNEIRRAISYVPQEPLLFHRSLAENISYGDPRASHERIVAAAKKAHAHDFIEKLDKGYETAVGERGVKLSGGQRQRIAIARAMLKNAPILVLDEATSALDSEAEALIQDALWTLMKGKTAVVIAHRLSTIQKMDRILVMDNGKIVEEGSHNSLLKKKNGLYAKLWKHQSGGFLQES